MVKTGKIIKELRINAGFTQKTLAEALHITDKAVSKWERGLCLPDMSLLPKLSLLLDVDMDVLIAKSIEQEEWIGVIAIQHCDFSQIIYDKPLVYYLLIHYLLLGITKIHVLTDEVNRKYLRGQLFTDLGFHFSFDKPKAANMMILDHPWFLFGSDLTQQFQGAMLTERNIKLIPQNQEPVFFFSHGSAYFDDPKKFMKTAAKRTLGRGMVCLDMNDYDKSLDVANFVRIYQQNTGLMIGDLHEVVVNHKSVEKL